MATHLYRIAQESITNAVRHGKARHIVVRLSRPDSHTILSVVDDGVGVPDPPPQSTGMGLRIMGHRTSIIGGTLSVRRAAVDGTVITCTLP